MPLHSSADIIIKVGTKSNGIPMSKCGSRNSQILLVGMPGGVAGMGLTSGSSMT